MTLVEMADPIGVAPAATSAPRVLIVEDHRMVADNLALALRATGADVGIAPCFDARGIVDHVRAHAADVAVVDLQLGAAASGADLIEPLTQEGALVIVVTGVTDPVTLASCVRRGAVGVVGKHEPFDRLVASVQRVIAAGDGFRRGERDALVDAARRAEAERDIKLAPFQRLTSRERSVLRLLVRGLQAEAIAEHSYVSLATVRSQIRAVLLKLGVNSQLAAVAMANAAEWTGEEV